MSHVGNAALRYSGMTTIVGGIEAFDQCIHFWASQLMASRPEAVLTPSCSLSDLNFSQQNSRWAFLLMSWAWGTGYTATGNGVNMEFRELWENIVDGVR
jgi:hypothetical protein